MRMQVILARVVQRMDNAIHRINHCPEDSVVCFVNTYPLDSVIQPLNNRALDSSFARPGSAPLYGGKKGEFRDWTRSQRAYCQQNKEQIRNYRSQYCKNNRERINEYWRSYYAKNKEQIRQRLRDQKQRKIGQNIVRFGAWDQESEKLETSLVPSDTLCGTPTVKT